MTAKWRTTIEELQELLSMKEFTNIHLNPKYLFNVSEYKQKMLQKEELKHGY